MTEDEARQRVAGMAAGSDLAQLERLVGLVLVESKRQNLIAASTRDRIWSRHVLDSIQLRRLAGDGWRHWLDIGSGGGFPGMALACIDPRAMTLVEPRGLRARFLEQLAAGLGLNHVSVRQQRVEQVSGTADVISARAVAPAGKLLQLAKHCATDDTVWLLPRGHGGEDEVETLSEHNSEMLFHVEQSLSDPTSTIIVGRGRPS